MTKRSIEHICPHCGGASRVLFPGRQKTMRQISVIRAPTAESPNRFQVAEAWQTFEVADGEVTDITLKHEMAAWAVGSALPGIVVFGAWSYGAMWLGVELPIAMSSGAIAGVLTFKAVWGYGVDMTFNFHRTVSGWLKEIDLSGSLVIWQGGAPDPPKPPETPLQMVVEHRRPDERAAWEVIDVPLNGSDKEANLRRYNELCIGTIQGKPFTYAEWTPLSTLLSRNEFDRVRQHWLDLEIVKALDDGQLYVLRSGKRTLAGLLRVQGLAPPRLVDAERGVSSQLA